MLVPCSGLFKCMQSFTVFFILWSLCRGPTQICSQWMEAVELKKKKMLGMSFFILLFNTILKCFMIQEHLSYFWRVAFEREGEPAHWGREE